VVSTAEDEKTRRREDEVGGSRFRQSIRKERISSSRLLVFSSSVVLPPFLHVLSGYERRENYT